MTSTANAPAPTMSVEQARLFRAAHEGEVRALNRKTIGQLREIHRAELAGRGAEILFGGPSGKDELMAAILEFRYPMAQLNETTHILYHNPGECWSACKFCHPHAGADCDCELGRPIVPCSRRNPHTDHVNGAGVCLGSAPEYPTDRVEIVS